MEFKRPDLPSRCTWKLGAQDSPHTKRAESADWNKVLPDILHAIGGTPMVKLNHIPKAYGIKCEMFAKCEYFNPGGSVKDRIAYRMIQDAEEKGILKPGSTIIEPTSGNTGIGLAMTAAIKGYRCIIVMPEKMSNEKADTLRAFGAEIIRTPTEASWDSPESHIAVSQKLQREIPNSVILDQYTNSGNPLAHYDRTANEIWTQCEGRIDYFVGGAGTGGTISGIGRRLKELSPETKIIAVDPKGSILARPSELNEGVGFYEVEGIGYDFIPTVLDHNVVDEWIKTEDCDSLNAARMLIRKEGLLCGSSSGSALVAALKIAKDLPEGKRLVLLLPDGVRNYMTKFLSDHWMEARGFIAPPEPVEENKWWWNMTLSCLSFNKTTCIRENTTTCQEAINIFEKTKAEQLLITDDGVHAKGVIVSSTLMSRLISSAVKLTDFVEKAMLKSFAKATSKMTLGLASRILEKESFIVVLDESKDNAILGIINQSHILNFITRNNDMIISNNHTVD